jgi:P4 family phage/plasmid primase-like protien
MLVKHLKGGGNLGLVPPEGVLVVDCDNAQAVAFVDARRAETTPIQKRRVDKQHFYFKYTPNTFHVYTRAGIRLEVGSDEDAKIDIKSCGNTDPKVPGGGYAVIPPSKHEEADAPYAWSRKLPNNIDDIPEIPLDIRNALLPFLTKGVKSDRADNRHTRVLKYQQRLVIEAREDSDDVRDEILDRTRAVARELYEGDPDRLTETLGSIERMYEGARNHEHAFQGYAEDGTDEFFAVMIADHLEGGLRYVIETKEWRGWDEETWVLVAPEGVKKIIGDFHREFLSEAAIEQDDQRQENLTKWARQLKGVHAVRRIYDRMLANLHCDWSEFDIDIDLMTFPSNDALGAEVVTINLRTGEVRAPNKDDMISRHAGSAYVEGAQHSMVDRFLLESFPDEETRRCALMHLSLSLLGWLPVERFYFMHGKGASGKGTLAAAMLAALGGYADTADPSTISGSGSLDGSRNAPDLYSMRGKRFIFVDEIAASRSLGTRLKNLTQDGVITAAGKYMKQTTFPIQWSTWIAGNARPKIDSTDKGLLRRIVEVPMDGGAVDNDHIDLTVKETLRRDDEAVAAFLWTLLTSLDEARSFKFNPPLSKEMLDATAEWVEGADMLAPWLAERIELSTNTDNSELASHLMADYEEWMDETFGRHSARDVPRATPNQMAAGLKARGCTRKRSKRGNVWIGVKIRAYSGELEKGMHLPNLPN